MSFLDRILPAKRAEAQRLAAEFAAKPPRRPEDMPIRDFAAAVAGPLAVIAEVKHKSPSHAHLRQDAPPARLAAAYRRGGAAALSVVTDQVHFGTSLGDVRSMRLASNLPVLVKDFVVDRSQIKAAWAAGADAVLLIARMVDKENLGRLLAAARQLGLAVLVECHDEQDIAKATAAGARIVGINNRNLATLTTDLGQTPRLLPLVPADVIKVSESGIDTREQITSLAAAGADAFLIGHALLLSSDPGRKVRELTGRETAGPARAKVCGLTTPEDAAACHQLGADVLGVIFADSPRQVGLDQAAAIRQAVPEARLCGVFQDAPLAEVVQAVKVCDLDLVQLHGSETPAYCAGLKAAVGLPLIKVLPTGCDAALAMAQFEAVAYFMVDWPKDASAGDADRLAEQALAQVQAVKAAGGEVFLAGGLTPENVGAALAAAPFAVDVCRGVETRPGCKDLTRVAAFLQEVK